MMQPQQMMPQPGNGNFFTGSPARMERYSNLDRNQQPLANQLVNAGLNRGAGGAFGQSADYYRDLLSDDSNTFNQLSAPELRRFREQLIPQLNEQFAGMHGGIGSSGHQQNLTNASMDLSERLGAIRAQLRQQGAQGLQNLGQQGLQSFGQNVYFPQSGGLLNEIGPAIGSTLAGAGSGYLQGGLPGALAGGFAGLASRFGKNTNPIYKDQNQQGQG